MTRGYSSPLRRLHWLTVAVLATVGISACGGGAHKKTTTQASTATTATSTTTAARPPAKKPRPKPIAEMVHTPSSTSFGPSAKASPGDAVTFRTTLSPAVKSPETVSVEVPGGPSRRLTITASSKGHVAKATILSATGKPLTLVRLHYLCSLPPEPTFCPAHDVVSDKKGYRMSFKTTAAGGINVSAFAGPVTLPTPKTITPGSSVVPAYTVTEQLKPILKHPTKASQAAPPVASISVHPGDEFLMITRVTSAVRGAAQPVTVTIDQGPGKSITVSAKVPGGQASTTTISSATGSPIELVSPRFTCFVAPIPTFCPPSHVQAASHQYKLTFSAAPGTPPPVVLAAIQAG